MGTLINFQDHVRIQREDLINLVESVELMSDIAISLLKADEEIGEKTKLFLEAEILSATKNMAKIRQDVLRQNARTRTRHSS